MEPEDERIFLDQLSNENKSAATENNVSNTSWINLMAGAISGPLSRTFTAPIDRVRMVIQVSSRREPAYQTFQNLLKDGGVRGLWRGNGINMLKIAPEMAVRFGIYDKFKKLMHDDERPLKISERFTCAAIAGVFGQILIYPLEVLKTRLTIRRTGEYAGIIDAAQKIFRREGIMAFYRGLKPSCIGVIPYTGVDLCMYETFKNYFGPTANLQAHQLIISAGSSTLLAQCSSYPFYLIKARLQANSKHYSMRALQEKSFCQLCRMFVVCLQTEGFFGLYRGLPPHLLKVIPAGILNYLIYERAYKLILYVKQ